MIPASSREKEIPVFLLFADISGYTQYVKLHKKTWAHGQFVISELIKSLIREIEVPLEITKLEGDAIFLIMSKAKSPTPQFLGEKLLNFFKVFDAQIQTLHSANICDCECCNQIGDLRLKLIVHSGTALFYRVDRFNEVSGMDVITLHRLAKNSISSKEYLLLTDAAYQEIQFSNPLSFVAGQEVCEGVGEIKTYVYFPCAPESGSFTNAPQVSWADKAIGAVKKMAFTWFSAKTK